MSIRLVVADTDTEYLKRLTDVLQGYEDLQLSVFDSADKLQEALLKKHIDVLLFSSDIYDGGLFSENIRVKIMLFDEDNPGNEAQRSLPQVQKYQSIPLIYQDMLRIYAEAGPGATLPGSKTKFIAFYSPVGGAGKTTLSLACASRLARTGHKVFYLNLEDMPSDEVYLHNSFDVGITEILNKLDAHINMEAKLRGLLQSREDGLSYTKHFDSPNDLREMTADEMGILLSDISATPLFEYVVVDMGCEYNARTVKVFETVDEIVLVERGDAYSEEKFKAFYSQLHIINEYGPKMKRVLNCYLGRKQELVSSIEQIGIVNMTQVADPAMLIDMLAGNEQTRFVERLL